MTSLILDIPFLEGVVAGIGWGLAAGGLLGARATWSFNRENFASDGGPDSGGAGA